MEKYFLLKGEKEARNLIYSSNLFFNFFKIEFGKDYFPSVIFMRKENNILISPIKKSRIEKIIQLDFPEKIFPFVEGVQELGIFYKGKSRKYKIYQSPVNLIGEL